MYYFDNAATTAQKPASVAAAVTGVLTSGAYGNPSRGAHGYALRALDCVLAAKDLVHQLFSAGDDYAVAFTHNSTTALNMVLKGLVRPGDHVLSTVWEHNAVLRPLYQLEEAGAAIDFIGCDAATGRLHYDELEEKLRPETRLVVCNHASNVTGNVLDLDTVKAFCQRHGLYLVLDVSQSAGQIPIDLSDGSVTAVCFTGHKSLYGPGGTGGLCIRRDAPVRPYITGGDGVHPFEHEQPGGIPAIFEAGTANVAGIAGLAAGIRYVLAGGTAHMARLRELGEAFQKGASAIPGLTLYGDFAGPRVPVFGLNIGSADAAVVSDLLWQDYAMATRPGFHCAPLLHEALGTEKQGIVRFSFSSFTKEEEIEKALSALRELSHF